MQNYELLFILPGTLSEDEVKPVVEAVKEVITQNGGVDYSSEDMGKSRLAYPINHIRYGYFQLSHFQAEASQVLVIEKKLKLMNQLLRALVQKYDPKNALLKINFESTLPTETPSTSVPIKSFEGNVKEEVVVQTPAPEVYNASAEEVTTEKEEVHPVVKKPAPRGRKKSEKVSLDEIDKKLDEILEIDINKV